MRKIIVAAFLSFSLFAGLLPWAASQTTVVVPPWRASSEGNGAGILPFGYNRVRLTQVISRSLLTGLGTKALIREVAYRRDGSIGPAMTRPASASWEVRMANLGVYPARPTPRFPDLQGLTRVFKPKKVNWPVLSRPASPPASWSLRFPLDTPFPYGGKNLVVDHYAFDASSGRIYTYACDWESPPPGGAGKVTPFGAGCPAGSDRATGTAPDPGGGDLALFLHGAPPGKPALAVLGTPIGNWGGLPLPFSLAGIGLPGCTLYTEWVLPVPLQVKASGLGEVYLPVPASRELLAGRLRAQFVVFGDPRVNPAVPLTTSEGLDILLGSRLGGRRPAMYVIQGTQFTARSRWGFLFEGEGPVLRLKI